MAKKKIETKTMITLDGLGLGSERFTVIVKSDNADQYPMLSRHISDGAIYQVVAIAPHHDGVSVEFVRVP